MKDIFSLDNKSVVIFGGAGFIGSQLVIAALDKGAKVVAADLNMTLFDRAEFAQVRANPNFLAVTCDVSRSDDVRGAYELCSEKFGFVNAFVNLAAYGKFDDISRQTDEDMAFSFDGVAGHMFRTVREAIPFLKESGGTIVLTSSMYGLVSPDYRIYGNSGQNNPALYGMGKAAVVQLTKYAAAHLAPFGIRVNCVAPGPVPDPSKNPPPEFLNNLAEKTMLGRVGTPEEMAGAFVYLLSDAASFTTGECIAVDGGWTKW
ncbi:MAG: SDR family oxidoreductase [Oscillospiraceae bacterium]|nr:SDR family oxidoreductase [Oscillospiraceae bacterium]